jgi:hypothetical protein
MCTVSSKLVLCTCTPKSVSGLKHYWVWYRFVEGKNEMVMGIPSMPFELNPETEALNWKTLQKRLNEPDAFDLDLKPMEKDRLQIHFSCGPEYYECVDYGFEYRKGNWRKKEFEFFNWLNHWDELQTGKIKYPLLRQKT